MKRIVILFLLISFTALSQRLPVEEIYIEGNEPATATDVVLAKRVTDGKVTNTGFTVGQLLTPNTAQIESPLLIPNEDPDPNTGISIHSDINQTETAQLSAVLGEDLIQGIRFFEPNEPFESTLGHIAAGAFSIESQNPFLLNSSAELEIQSPTINNIATSGVFLNAPTIQLNTQGQTINVGDVLTATSGAGNVQWSPIVQANGSVTTHNDVTDAGSGAIITAAERASLHDAVTVTNSRSIELGLTGQNIIADIVDINSATNGQILSTDGTGNAIWIDQSSPSVLIDGGDGTFRHDDGTGNLTNFDVRTSSFFNENSTDVNIDPSVDATRSGRIGIGIANPAAQIDTSEDIQINGIEIGVGAGNVLTNTRVGNVALRDNTTGSRNTAVGSTALRENETGTNNTGLGTDALQRNLDGINNTAVGRGSLGVNTSGSNNTGVGVFSNRFLIDGDSNTAIGNSTLVNNTNGSDNTALGQTAGTFFSGASTAAFALTDVNEGVFIGQLSSPLADVSVNEIAIGATAVGNGSNTATIGNNAITDTYLAGDVHADAFIVNSDSRLKTNLVDTGLTRTINGTTVTIYAFDYTLNGSSQLGVLAQDVQAAMAGLPQAAIDAVLIENTGRDDNATLAAMNTAFTGTATTINEAYEIFLDQAVKDDLEANGFPVINRTDALIEFAEFEAIGEENLNETQLDRYTRYLLVDFTGNKEFATYDVIVNDILSLNTTALQWVL